jgi:hypothetical protein
VVQSDEELSKSIMGHLQHALPKPDENSTRPLDQALGNLKRVRDKALAHHERVDSASLIVPSWAKLAQLIDTANAASSLRQLLTKAGLRPASGRNEGAV